jgi:phosphoserine phosphatase RsbU/P
MKAKNRSKRFKILAVDDNLVNIKFIENILRQADYTVESASDGHQALNLLRKTYDYDLILLDIDMPEINGFEVCKAIREDELLKEVPVIFLTGFCDTDNIVAGFEVGAQDYITKPFNVKELLARVDTHIQLKHKSDQIKEMNQLLEYKNNNITNSILYARYIQESIIPSCEILAEVAPEYFILQKPKDIVSGDFYWFKKIKNLLYIAVADCTGHGVPGAFLSILGILGLNQIVTQRSVNHPNFILTELRKKVKRMLNQYKKEFETNDGIDIAFCLINFDDNTLEYAGANCPLYLIRKKEKTKALEFVVKKANRMPVGIHPNDDQDFTNHRIKLRDGDRLYMFSDGYVAQFGGEQNKTFKTKRFQEALMDVQNKPMLEQGLFLDKTIQNWQGDCEQVDDMLVIGIQIDLPGKK